MDKRHRRSSTANLITTLTVLNEGPGVPKGVFPLRGERTRGLAPSARTCEGSFRPELAREPVQSRSPPINPATYHSASHRPYPLVTVGTETDGSGTASQLCPVDSPSPFTTDLGFFSLAHQVGHFSRTSPPVECWISIVLALQGSELRNRRSCIHLSPSPSIEVDEGMGPSAN